MTEMVRKTQNILPAPPAGAVAAASLVPALVTGSFVFGLARLDAPASAYVAGLAVLGAVFGICAPEILAFPANARGVLDQTLELARSEGTSWFPDIRAQGRCALITLGQFCARAGQLRDSYVLVLRGLAGLHLGLALTIGIAAARGWCALGAMAWAIAACGLAAAYLLWLAQRYRQFGPLGPDEQAVLDAADLHLRCDQERRAELMGLIKKG